MSQARETKVNVYIGRDKKSPEAKFLTVQSDLSFFFLPLRYVEQRKINNFIRVNEAARNVRSRRSPS